MAEGFAAAEFQESNAYLSDYKKTLATNVPTLFNCWLVLSVQLVIFLVIKLVAPQVALLVKD